MNNLQSSIAVAIGKDIEINKENLIKVSTACTTIAVEFAGNFSEWCSDNKYQFMGDNQWLDYDRSTVFTSQLIQQYFQHLNKK